MKKWEIFLIFIIISLIYYGYLKIFLRTPFTSGGDIFETIGYSNKLKTEGSIKSLKDVKGCTSCPFFPIYSKFPGLFLLVTIISLITSYEVVFITIILNLILLTLYGLLFFLIIKKTIKLFNFRVKKYLILIIVIFSLFLVLNIGNNFLFLGSGSINFFLFLVFFNVFLLTFSSENDINFLILTSIFLLSFLLFHHQTTLSFFLPILLLLGIKIYKKQVIFEKRTFFVFVVFTLLLFFYFYFILGDLNYLLRIGSEIASSEESIENKYEQIPQVNLFGSKTNQFILPFLIMAFLSIPTVFKRNKILSIVFILFLIYGLVGFYQKNIFGTLFFPERFILYITLSSTILSSLFFINLLDTPNFSIKIFSIFSIVLFLFLLISDLVIKEPFFITTKYIEIALNFKKIASEFNGCSMSDPASLFMFGKIADIEPCYNYPRPSRFVRNYYFSELGKLDLYGEDIDIIYDNLKAIDSSFLIFDTILTPAWTPKINENLIHDLNNSEKFTLILNDSYLDHYNDGKKNYENPSIIIFLIN